MVSSSLEVEGNVLLSDREYREGRVRLWRDRNGLLLLQVGGKIEGTGPSDLSNTLLLAYLPIGHHRDPRSFLTIGLGAGGTLSAAKKHVKDEALVEINPGVVEALRRHGPPALLDGVRITVNDARNYLYLTSDHFDIISSEPSYPTEASVVGLFTRKTKTIIDDLIIQALIAPVFAIIITAGLWIAIAQVDEFTLYVDPIHKIFIILYIAIVAVAVVRVMHALLHWYGTEVAARTATDVDVDVLIADTADRLHNKDNLMEELKKVVRVLGKLDPSAPQDVMLVLDAGTGQNALSQAESPRSSPRACAEGAPPVTPRQPTRLWADRPVGTSAYSQWADRDGHVARSGR